ncbi:hypothetical protein GCM10007875_23440 [Limnobacter litoralis]|uniref:DUF4145 domain-containing protein n=2 Tax=Limnobacter litoralis TaxID=481366 RepID=A0ABQ5YWH1_9BURK|nr:hypothetical protein GCM10007875_23440 [Limnobacter litoralis]
MLHCNACFGLRWHSVLFSTRREYVQELDEDDEYREVTDYQLAECNGCEAITLHTRWANSGQPEPIEEQWPPKISRRQPKWMMDLFWLELNNNSFKQDFIQEIYSALKAGNRRLAVLGVRALLEQVMLENVGDQGNFLANLNKFELEGFISRLQREALQPVVEAGHASMHRGFKASETEIDSILDVLENVMESIYVSKHRVSGIRVPNRRSKP